MWRIIAILLSIAGAVSSNPGAGAEGAPMVPTIQYQCKCGVVQSVATSDTDYGKVDDNDLMNEQKIVKETDGTVSEGQSKDGLTYGEGTCKWIDGNIFDGDLLFGKPHGDGKMKYKDGREYDGEMLFGKLHGDGKMKYKDGSEYDGEWAGNKMHGRGKYTWPNGDVYVGEFAEGKRHGAGTFTSMWQVYRYQGGWSYGKPHGKGVVAWFRNFFEFEVEFEDGQLVDVFTVKFASLKRLFVAVDSLLRLLF
eukprot:scaffold19253_cov82-Skeletonema_marinoi.AAC.1